MSNAPDRFPSCERNRFFQGKFLSARDLQREQDYFLTHRHFQNRHFHGHGILCGLAVEVSSNDSECGKAIRTIVHPGVAIDARGREIVVARPAELVVATGETGDLCLSFKASNQVKVPCLDRHGDARVDFEYNKVVESYELAIRSHSENSDEVLLGSIRNGVFEPSRRRHIGLAQTVICGTTWDHAESLRRQKLVVAGWRISVDFSGPLAAPGAFDAGTCSVTMATEDGRMVRVDRKPDVIQDADQGISRLEIPLDKSRLRGGSPWLHVTLRCDSILDAQGRPIGGQLLGGQLPTSRQLGGIFESWFQLGDDDTSERHSDGK